MACKQSYYWQSTRCTTCPAALGKGARELGEKQVGHFSQQQCGDGVQMAKRDHKATGQGQGGSRVSPLSRSPPGGLRAQHLGLSGDRENSPHVSLFWQHVQLSS